MTFDILVNDGYRYQYCKTITASSVQEARRVFSANCAPSQRDFRVRKVRG